MVILLSDGLLYVREIPASGFWVVSAGFGRYRKRFGVLKVLPDVYWACCS